MNAYGVGLGTRHVSHAIADAARTRVKIRFDRFDLDEANARLIADGSPVELAPKPFAVLCALARRPGSLVTKNELLDEVWGHHFVTESVLKTVIAKLRRALNDDAHTPRFIETVARRGYRFILADRGPQVEAADAAMDAATITPETAWHRIGQLLQVLIAHAERSEGAVPGLLDFVSHLEKTQSRRFADDLGRAAS